MKRPRRRNPNRLRRKSNYARPRLPRCKSPGLSQNRNLFRRPHPRLRRLHHRLWNRSLSRSLRRRLLLRRYWPQKTQEPVENVVPEPEPVIQQPEPEPVIEPEVQDVPPEPQIQPDPEPQLDYEIFEEPIDPVQDPEPIEETVLEPIIGPEPQDITPEPEIDIEPLPEPIEETIEPDPEIEVPEPINEPDIVEPEPDIEIDPSPFVTPEPDEVEPTPGAIIPDAEPEPDFEELEVPAPTEIETETPEPATAPVETETTEPDPTEASPIVTTAPTILASPEAPSNADEAERAVPQSQSNPMFDPLQRPGGGRSPGRPSSGSPGSGGAFNPQLGGPSQGGGNNFGGGTRRANPGAGGWQLDPNARADSGEGYGGVIKDMRCREENRTHLDCPEYQKKFQGRNNSGFESFGSHSIGSTATRSPRAGTTINPAIGGGSDPWKLGIGDNSMNAGGPSGSVLDDADFGRTFPNTPLGTGEVSGRVRDIFRTPTDPWEEPPLETLPTPPGEDEDGGN